MTSPAIERGCAVLGAAVANATGCVTSGRDLDMSLLSLALPTGATAVAVGAVAAVAVMERPVALPVSLPKAPPAPATVSPTAASPYRCRGRTGLLCHSLPEASLGTPARRTATQLW